MSDPPQSYPTPDQMKTVVKSFLKNLEHGNTIHLDMSRNDSIPFYDSCRGFIERHYSNRDMSIHIKHGSFTKTADYQLLECMHTVRKIDMLYIYSGNGLSDMTVPIVKLLELQKIRSLVLDNCNIMRPRDLAACICKSGLESIQLYHASTEYEKELFESIATCHTINRISINTSTTSKNLYNLLSSIDHPCDVNLGLNYANSDHTLCETVDNNKNIRTFSMTPKKYASALVHRNQWHACKNNDTVFLSRSLYTEEPTDVSPLHVPIADDDVTVQPPSNKVRKIISFLLSD